MPALALTLAIATPFVFAEFNFGYFVGFYLFVVSAAYFWLNAFSLLDYQHELALLSSATSIILFLVPILMTGKSPWRARQILPDLTPEIILISSIVLLVVSAFYGIRVVNISDMETHRTTIVHPRWLEYMIWNTCGATIPFATAWVVMQRRWLMASAFCTVLLLFYPITLTKTALYAGPFLLFLSILSRYVSPKWAVLLSLLVPLSVGQLEMASALWFGATPLGLYPFGIFNVRLLAFPAISLDHCYAFFSNHPLTHFCQISLLKPFMNCPYKDQLGVVLADTYHLGTMNASLLATEGVASVGLILAPLVAVVCGAVIALGTLCSDGLPARFVLISGCIIAISLLNVPLSTITLTGGYGLLIILWFLAPRALFKDADYSHHNINITDG